MGKATILEHLGAGQYSISLEFDLNPLYSRRIQLNTMILELEALIAGGGNTDMYELQLAGAEQKLAYVNRIIDSYDDLNVVAWCADKTTNLTGDVGLAEIAAARENGYNIVPGYVSAAFNPATDGNVTPLVGQGAPMAFYNLAMLPGTQKWKPTYRYGAITALSEANNTCSVTLESEESHIQAISLDQEMQLEDVPFEYMSCDYIAFEVGDNVLVQFTDQDWAQPKVVGFKDNPKSCDTMVIFRLYRFPSEDREYIVINLRTLDLYEIDGVVQPFNDTTLNSVVLPLLPPVVSNKGFTDNTTETLVGSGGAFCDSYHYSECAYRDVPTGDLVAQLKNETTRYPGVHDVSYYSEDGVDSKHTFGKYEIWFGATARWKRSVSLVFSAGYTELCDITLTGSPVTNICGQTVNVGNYISLPPNFYGSMFYGDGSAVCWQRATTAGPDQKYYSLFDYQYQIDAIGNDYEWDDFLNGNSEESLYNYFGTTKADYLTEADGSFSYTSYPYYAPADIIVGLDIRSVHR